jgi:hypothetical protein
MAASHPVLTRRHAETGGIRYIADAIRHVQAVAYG